MTARLDMPQPTTLARPRSCGWVRRRSGFTFIEVMFAVLVLAAGVVMIATLLPAALRMTEETREDALGQATLEAGFHAFRTPLAGNPSDLTSLPVSADTAATPNFRVMTWPASDEGGLTQLQRGMMYLSLGNRVSSVDPRQMWTPFYYRPSAEAAPQVAMVAQQARDVNAFPQSASATPGLFDAYFACDLTGTEPPFAAGTVLLGNHPLPVLVSTQLGSPADATILQESLYTISLTTAGGSILPSQDQIDEAIVEGAAVVVPDALGRLRVYRIGELDERTPGTGVTGEWWYLSPDGELDRDAYDATGNVNLDAVTLEFGYLVGRMLAEPNGDVGDWDATDNPHVGISPVTGHLDGVPLR